eukprot:SAG11_NODE_57_length_19200_cov_18.288417_12_plen_83_part_00
MMKRNPQQMMQQLQGCMDPRMMQQLGGGTSDPQDAPPHPIPPQGQKSASKTQNAKRETKSSRHRTDDSLTVAVCLPVAWPHS